MGKLFDKVPKNLWNLFTVGAVVAFMIRAIIGFHQNGAALFFHLMLIFLGMALMVVSDVRGGGSSKRPTTFPPRWKD